MCRNGRPNQSFLVMDRVLWVFEVYQVSWEMGTFIQFFFFFCDFLKLRILVNTRPITNLLNHFFKHPKPILILKFLSIQIKCNTRPMLILNDCIKIGIFGIFLTFSFL